MTKSKSDIINNPDQWIISKKGEFIRIKDSELWVDPNIQYIREELKKPFGPNKVIRFKEPTAEQVSQERYNKLYKDNEYNYDKIHAWLYDSQNQDKLEVVKLTGTDFKEAVQAIFKAIKQTKAKWRLRWKGVTDKEFLVNEESGQILWATEGVSFTELEQDKGILIAEPRISEPREEHKSTVIVVPGPYGWKDEIPIEENFPNTKFIYLYQPILKSDAWHGAKGAPGVQEKNWNCITGDLSELKSDPKDFDKNQKIAHLDNSHTMRAVDYINYWIEQESGIIYLLGQGEELSVTALSSSHKLSGAITGNFFVPVPWDEFKLLGKNKDIPPIIIVENKNRTSSIFSKFSYEFWKKNNNNIELKEVKSREEVDEVMVKELKTLLNREQKDKQPQEEREKEGFFSIDNPLMWLSGIGIIALVVVIILIIRGYRKTTRSK